MFMLVKVKAEIHRARKLSLTKMTLRKVKKTIGGLVILVKVTTDKQIKGELAKLLNDCFIRIILMIFTNLLARIYTFSYLSCVAG